MKKTILLFLAAVLLSANSFSQIKIPEISIEKRSGDNIGKMINAEIKYADQYSKKISPLLNLFLDSILTNKGVYVRIPESKSGLKDLVFFQENEMKEILIPVFIKTLSVLVSESMISVFGGKTQSVAGDIIVADVPISSVKELSLSPEIVYIEHSSVSKVKINVSRIETKVDQLHNGTGISRPYKGNGVIVGIIDSGIDWKHQDFKNSSGSRINYLWDMSGSGNAPSGFGYGTEYTKAQIDTNQCSETDGDDGHGHGTHVAGTAAGNGNALSSYIGMAPESDIIFVKGFRTGPGFADVDVVNGCNYIFQKAQQMSKPAVINMSLGGHYGPHDGTSLYEQALSNLTGNGKVIVAAAGNEGGETIHLNYTTTGNSYNNSYETFVELYTNATVFAADMWYSPGNISVGLAAYDNSLNLIGYTNPIAPGQKIEDLAFTINSTTYGYVTVDATGINNPNNGANEVIIAIDSHNGQVNIGNVYWTVYTFGTGTFDAWAFTGGQFSTYTPANFIKPGDNQKTVGMPSTAGKVICVGSYVTKTQWVDYNGVTQNQPGNPVIGQISSFSSIGPSRDGRIKPDICAPGEVIVAAYSSFLTQTPPSSILQGGQHQKMQGTSMATPHVTGVIALLLEKNPSLNYDQTVAILKNTTKKDGYTGTTPNNIYGSGKLDAYNAFLNTSGGGGGTQTTIIQEGFDGTFLPTGWTKQTLNSNNTWIQSNPQNNNFNQIDPNSQYSALVAYDVNQNQDEWLITPSFNLGSGNASIEFYAGYSTNWLSGATLKLHISTNGGNNWTNLWTAENDGQSWNWRNKIIDLTSYSNKQNLKLGWQYVGVDGDLAGIDGVKLIGYTMTDVEDDNNTIVTDYSLNQNYPNPFNPTTIISWQAPVSGHQTLKVYDLLGREVATLVDEYKTAGVYNIEFNAENLASGVYIYQLKSGEFLSARKMILMK